MTPLLDHQRRDEARKAATKSSRHQSKLFHRDTHQDTRQDTHNRIRCQRYKTAAATKAQHDVQDSGPGETR